MYARPHPSIQGLTTPLRSRTRLRMLRAMSTYGSGDLPEEVPPQTRRRTTTFVAPPPRLRKGSVRLPFDAARRLAAGHPWVFRDTIGRPLSSESGDVVDLFDPEGTFIARGIYDPEGPIAVRTFTRDPNEVLDSAALMRRVRAAARMRNALLPTDDLTAYRVIHGEGDFLPGITVDRYGDYLVMHVFSASLSKLSEQLIPVLREVHTPKSIYVQKRYRPLGGEGPREPAEMAWGEVAPLEIEVREGSLRMGVDVTAPLGTGLFPDLRNGRMAVAARAKDRRVLNLFSYTGALSLAAAAGGAKEVVSVDLSAKAHARARRNLQLSGMSEDIHEFIAADALTVMARMADRKRLFDMVIIDPPAFAHSRERAFSVERDYRELVSMALRVCDSGALLCCAVNAHRFSLDALITELGEGASRARRLVRIVEQVGLPADFPLPAGFPDGNYLKFVVCSVV